MGTLLVIMALAAAAPPVTMPLPGRWETEVRMDVGAVPGLPPRTAAALRRLAGRPRIAWVCLSPGAAPDLVLSGDSSCRIEAMTASIGTLGYRRLCPGAAAMLRGSGGGSSFAVIGDLEDQPGLRLMVRGRRLAPTC